MAVNTTPVFVKTPKFGRCSFTNSDSANTKKTIATAGADGTKWPAKICVTSTDTSARVGQLWLTRSATSTLIGSFSVPAASGTDGTTASADLASLLSTCFPVDNDGQRYGFAESGDTLDISFTAQVTSGKEIDCHIPYGNFS